MSVLDRFERRLESAISGVFARAFRSAVQPVEIAAALQRETDNNTQILSRDRRLVPNVFQVELAESDLARLSPYDETLVTELTRQLREHAQQQGYVFPGPVAITLEDAEDLTTGRFRVRSKAQASVTASHRTTARTIRAYLEVNGTRHPLRPPSTIVGRGTDTDIRINDPGISRQHVEFLLDPSEVIHTGGEGYSGVRVRDLGSTNGMVVDGRVIKGRNATDTQAPVADRSTVRIGNTTLTVRLVPDPVTAGAPEDQVGEADV